MREEHVRSLESTLRGMLFPAIMLLLPATLEAGGFAGSVTDPAAGLAVSTGFAPVYAVLVQRCGACHVRGRADGPFSLDTPPSAERFPECIEAPEPVRCATYHELVDAPGEEIPPWIRPDEAASSEPYVQACVAEGSFHIGQSLPAALPEAECETLLHWIASGAAY